MVKPSEERVLKPHKNIVCHFFSCGTMDKTLTINGKFKRWRSISSVPERQAVDSVPFFPNTEGLYKMKNFTAVIEKCPETGLYVGFVPGFPGAHSQAETLDELNKNLEEVVAMLLEDGEPELEGEFVGTQNVVVA